MSITLREAWCKVEEWCANPPWLTDIDKALIIEAIQSGIEDPGPDEQVEVSATIVGFEPWQGVFSPGLFDLNNPAQGPLNPACAPNIGYLVIDLGLPAGVTGSATTSYPVVDLSAGWGTAWIIEKSTNTVLFSGSGNGGSITFTIPAGVDSSDLCLVFNAWGANDNPDNVGRCDEIGPGETIITVAPSECAPAAACFEALFGCSVGDILNAEGGLELLNDVAFCVNDAERPVYRIAPADAPGALNREWHDTFAPAVPLSTASTTAFGAAVRLGHDFTATPDTTSTVTTLALNDTNNTASEGDVQVLDTVALVPAGGVWVQWSGGSEGYWAVEVGECCGPLTLRDELGYSDREDNTQLLGPVFLPEGQHSIRVWNIDSGGTNSSHQDFWSTDGETFVGTPQLVGVELNQSKRPVECELIGLCDPVEDGWSLCYPTPCTPGIVDPLPEPPAAASLEIATTLPVPDNETDTAIRTGFEGSTGLVSDAGHNHAIRRQVHPEWPGVTVNGNVDLLQELVLDRRSTEEWVEYEIRTRVSVAAGNNWPIITVPPLAGFQQPLIVVTNTYRNGTSSYQEDDQPTGSTVFRGAAPVGPYMGIEWSHWSSTRGLHGPFRRENNITSWFVGFSAKYVRL